MKFITKDIFEAAYLKAKGMRMSRAIKSRHSVLLEFEGDVELDILKTNYQAGRAEVNIKNLKDELREVKDVVFSIMRKEEENQAFCLAL